MSNSKQFLKPAEGRTVPRKDGTPCPPEGDYWDNDLYTRRRIQDHDLVRAKLAPAPPARPSSKEETKE